MYYSSSTVQYDYNTLPMVVLSSYLVPRVEYIEESLPGCAQLAETK